MTARSAAVSLPVVSRKAKTWDTSRSAVVDSAWTLPVIVPAAKVVGALNGLVPCGLPRARKSVNVHCVGRLGQSGRGSSVPGLQPTDRYDQRDENCKWQSHSSPAPLVLSDHHSRRLRADVRIAGCVIWRVIWSIQRVKDLPHLLRV